MFVETVKTEIFVVVVEQELTAIMVISSNATLAVYLITKNGLRSQIEMIVMAKEFYCPECGVIFNSEEKLKEHIIIHE